MERNNLINLIDISISISEERRALLADLYQMTLETGISKEKRRMILLLKSLMQTEKRNLKNLKKKEGLINGISRAIN